MDPNKFSIGTLEEGLTTVERAETGADAADAVPEAILNALAARQLRNALGTSEAEALAEPVLPFADTPAFRGAAARRLALGEFVPARPQYPNGTAAHLNSHQAQLTQLIASGEIPAGYEDVLRLFIELHDRGYAGETEALSADEYQANVATYDATYRDLGATPDEAKHMIRYAYTGLRDQNPGKQHLLGRVIPHAVNSVKFGREILRDEAGLSDEQALALAKLFATHHFGYPLTPLVTDVAKMMGADIPADLQEKFFIGGEEVGATDTDGTAISPERREQIAQDRADVIRARIADEVAPVLGITPEQSRAIAAIQYALDRMTPARRMRALKLNADGSMEWTGGETEKRYPLVVRDVATALKKGSDSRTKADIGSMYTISAEQFRKEAAAAIRTANNLGVTGLDEVIRRNSEREIRETEAMHARALAVAEQLGVGTFAAIEADTARVVEAYQAGNHPDAEALDYLLGTMKKIQPAVEQNFPKQ